MTADTARFTEDRLLGGRVVLRQPVDGFRAAIDPVLLAASINAQAGETVLELGCGSGAAALCLARRVDGVTVIGLDAQADLVALAAGNARLNKLHDRAGFFAADIGAPALAEGRFDHVMANPPYLVARDATLPPDPARAAAVAEGAADLALWLKTAAHLVRPKGSVTIIHRADRLDAIFAAAPKALGSPVLLPLWPGIGKPAKRVIVSWRRQGRAPFRLLAGLILHEADGGFTPAAERILRAGADWDR